MAVLSFLKKALKRNQYQRFLSQFVSDVASGLSLWTSLAAIA
jgi:hypothetical protein